MSMDPKTMARIRQQDQDAMEGLPPPAGLLLDYIDDDLLPALRLAQRWLANCVPTAELDGPKPLPIIAAVLAKAQGTDAAQAAKE